MIKKKGGGSSEGFLEKRLLDGVHSLEIREYLQSELFPALRSQLWYLDI